jgi:hypothetical protein
MTTASRPRAPYTPRRLMRSRPPLAGQAAAGFGPDRPLALAVLSLPGALLRAHLLLADRLLHLAQLLLERPLPLAGGFVPLPAPVVAPAQPPGRQLA